MPKSEKFSNPFYGLVLLTGIAFVVTATAYGVMALQEARAEAAVDAPADKHPLMVWMNRHGDMALMTELALLTVFTMSAIGTDDYWQRRRTKTRSQPPNHEAI